MRYKKKSEDKNKALNEYITKDSLLCESLDDHGSVFVMGMDIYLPKELDKKIVSKFKQKFIAMEKYKGYDPKYYIAQGYDSLNGEATYNMGLILDGNKTDNITEHVENAKKVLQKVVGPEYADKVKIDLPIHPSSSEKGVIATQDNGEYNNALELFYCALIGTVEDSFCWHSKVKKPFFLEW